MAQKGGTVKSMSNPGNAGGWASPSKSASGVGSTSFVGAKSQAAQKGPMTKGTKSSASKLPSSTGAGKGKR